MGFTIHAWPRLHGGSLGQYKLFYFGFDYFGLNGFLQVIDHARAQCLFSAFRAKGRAAGNDRYMGCRGVFLNGFGGLYAGDIGEIEIHEYKIRFSRNRFFYRLGASPGTECLVAKKFQVRREDSSQMCIVVDYENGFCHVCYLVRRGDATSSDS